MITVVQAPNPEIAIISSDLIIPESVIIRRFYFIKHIAMCVAGGLQTVVRVEER